MTAVLGIGLGVGFALLSSNAFDRSSGFALGVGMTGQQMVMEGVAIPLGGAVLMLTPVVVIRLIGPPTRESLEAS